MKISIIGPTNIEKFSAIIGKPIDEITRVMQGIGKTLAAGHCDIVLVFDYQGMRKTLGDAFKAAHGKTLEMLYTENDYDWNAKPHLKFLKYADVQTKKPSWHDILLSLVSDSDIVLCAGLSAGVLAELGYMKWNYQEKRGRVKQLIGIKELLRDGEFPPEISYELEPITTICSVNDLPKVLKKFNK